MALFVGVVITSSSGDTQPFAHNKAVKNRYFCTEAKTVVVKRSTLAGCVAM